LTEASRKNQVLLQDTGWLRSLLRVLHRAVHERQTAIEASSAVLEGMAQLKEKGIREVVLTGTMSGAQGS
jgi:hypothetical protein